MHVTAADTGALDSGVPQSKNDLPDVLQLDNIVTRFMNYAPSSRPRSRTRFLSRSNLVEELDEPCVDSDPGSEEPEWVSPMAVCQSCNVEQDQMESIVAGWARVCEVQRTPGPTGALRPPDMTASGSNARNTQRPKR